MLTERDEDMLFYVLARARELTDTGEEILFDDVLAEFGLTQVDLDASDDCV